MFCTNCGKQLEDGSKFCTNCGSALDAAPASPAPTQQAYDAPAPVPPVYSAPEQPAYASQTQQSFVASEQQAYQAPQQQAYQAPQQQAYQAPQQQAYQAPQQQAYQAPQQQAYQAPQQQAYQTSDASGFNASTARQYDYSQQTPPQNAPTAPEKKKKGKLGLLIGIIVAAVVVIGAVVALFLTGVFSGAKGTVEKALNKSVKAYSSAVDALDPIDLKALSDSNRFSSSASFELKELDGDDSLKGLGANIVFNYDGEGRNFDLSATPFFGSADIASLQVAAVDSKIYLGSPELTDGEFYGIDTVTFGKDAAELIGDDEVESLSFNIFDVIDSAKKITDNCLDSKGLEAANKELKKSIEVKKNGSDTIDVNGNTVKATSYHVVIPQKALEAYVDSLCKCIRPDKYAQNLEDLIITMGMPQDEFDHYFREIDDLDMDDLADEINDNLIKELGDLEFDVYVSGGYISSVEFEEKLGGEKVSINACFGGGKNYVDDISITFVVDNDEYKFTSSGDHSCSNGTFTDKSEFVNNYGSYSDVILKSNIEYVKKSGDIEIDVTFYDEITLKAAGTLNMDSNTFDLDLSSLKICDDWNTYFSGAAAIKLSAYDKAAFSVKDGDMILEMDDNELEELATRVTGNAEEIADDLGIDLSFLGIGYNQEDYDEGILAGYDAGYSVGYDDGWDEVSYGDNYDDDPSTYGPASSSRAFREGFAEGYDYGYLDGYYDGYPGYEYGYSYGESLGWDIGNSGGYEEGLSTGYDEGYEVGYDDGWDEVEYGYWYDDDPSSYGYTSTSNDFCRGFYDGYIGGYYDGYWDGYPGYERYYSYGENYGVTNPGENTDGISNDEKAGMEAGYNMGYMTGYWDGWDEVEYGENADDAPDYYGFPTHSDDFVIGFEEGYAEGYLDGYYDGYPGYEMFYSYGECFPGGDSLAGAIETYEEAGIDLGYSLGYQMGYSDGWDEVEYGENLINDPTEWGFDLDEMESFGANASRFSEAFGLAFEQGYLDGYYDGYPGYDMFYSYSESGWRW